MKNSTTKKIFSLAVSGLWLALTLSQITLGAQEPNVKNLDSALTPFTLAAQESKAKAPDAVLTPTAFTYQGQLKDVNGPVSGAFDFQFVLYSTQVGGERLGASEMKDMALTNGMFNLKLDFDRAAVEAKESWLEIGVRPSGGAEPYTVLFPRQKLTPTPYAIFAQHEQWSLIGVPVGFAGSVEKATVITDEIADQGVTDAKMVSEETAKSSDSLKGKATDAESNTAAAPQGTANYIAKFDGAGNPTANSNMYEPINGVTSFGPAGSVYGYLVAGGSPGPFPTIGFNAYGTSYLAGVTGYGGILQYQNGDGKLIYYTGSNVSVGLPHAFTPRFMIDNNGDATLTGNVFFGSQTRQMLNMYGTGFGIGVQTANLYFRSGAGFAWHAGGVHNDATYNSGGGTTLMTLDSLGLSFGARLGQHLRLWSDNAARYFGIGIQAETIYFRSGNGAGDGFAWYKGGFHNDGHRNAGGGQTLMTLDGESGLSVKVLQILGGSDLSENFDVKGSEPLSHDASPADVRPGMVVAIDTENPGKLIVSHQAYDRRVAGIVSGAGGVKPGMVMGQEGTVADGAHPVALSGRVYCWADASDGSIEPGDLLTTSDTPGHAMKVTNHKKANGAIIGKAMTKLEQGKGLVLVLVTLQ